LSYARAGVPLLLLRSRLPLRALPPPRLPLLSRRASRLRLRLRMRLTLLSRRRSRLREWLLLRRRRSALRLRL
jgi:hypothetical protein